MELHFKDRAPWRSWLEKNHCSVREVWLVFYKKHTGVPNITYEAAVEEALCFGWIDSLIRRLDEDRYTRKFTPRKDTTRWSELNLKRVAKLEAAGRMTAAGLAKVDRSAASVIPPSKRNFEIPPYFQEALAGDDKARRFFDQLAPSYQRDIIGWVGSAKRDETRRRRLAEAMTLLHNKQKLGMK